MQAFSPRLVRRLAAAALGAGLVAGPTAAFAAGPFDPGWGTRPAATSTEHRPTARPPGSGLSAGIGATRTAGVGQVVVQPGDCLWRIAAEHLPPGAGTAEIQATWPKWFDANRAVIGADPDLIHPGQHLVPPQTTP